MNRSSRLCALAGAFVLGVLILSPAAGADKAKDKAKSAPIAIADVKRAEPVKFEKDILPILAKNCLACHSATKKENGLVLESVASILKGGDEGPAIVAKKSGDSLLLKAAAHQNDTVMPPEDNDVGAKPLTPDELGLIKLWIDQGAVGEAIQQGPVKWQPLPPGINPIYAVAMTPDGQYAACGRANQIFVYHVASGRLVTRLTDPELLKSGLYKTAGVAHLDLVQSLAFNPEGTLLASGGFREVKLWRRPQNVRKADLTGLAEPAEALAVSPDGKRAVTGEAGGLVRLWDLATYKEIKSLAGHTGAVTSVRFFAGGEKIASGSADKTIRIWNAADGAALAKIDTPAAVGAIAVLGDGAQLASGGGDNLIRIWNVPTAPPAEGQPAPVPAAQLTGHNAPVVALEASPTEKTQLVSAAGDGIRVWNLQNNQQLRQMDHGGPVTAIAIRADGQQLASAGANNLIKLWKPDGQAWNINGQPVPEMKGDFRAQLKLASVTRLVPFLTNKAAAEKKAVTDAEARVTATAEAIKTSNTAKEATAKTLAEKLAAMKAPVDAKAAADKELETAVAALTAATEQAATAKAAGEKQPANEELKKAAEQTRKNLEEADRKKKEAEKKAQDANVPAAKATQEFASAEAAAMAADQAAAAAVISNQKAIEAVPLAQAVVKQVEAALVQAQAELTAAQQAATAGEKPVRALAYSADSSQLASGGDNQVVRTWSSATGAPIDTFAGHQAAVHAVAFTPDGQLLSSAVDKTATLWDPNAGWTLERTIGSSENSALLVDRVVALSFSPDGKLLATGGGEPSRSGELKIWNVADGAAVKTIEQAHSDTIFGVEFSPDGKYLASSAADRFVKVFDAASGTLARSFEGHTHHVLDVAWRADGKVLASCGADNVMKVWDFTTGDQKATSQALSKEMTSIAFVADSTKALISGGDKSVRLYNTDNANGGSEKNYPGCQDFMYSAAASADGKLAIGGGQDSQLLVWTIENTQLLRTFEAPKPETPKVEATAEKK